MRKLELSKSNKRDEKKSHDVNELGATKIEEALRNEGVSAIMSQILKKKNERDLIDNKSSKIVVTLLEKHHNLHD